MFLKMEFKVVISDPESGRSYQREIKDEKAARLRNLKIGSEFDGSVIGLSGYTLKITGGSDKSGFPMKKGVHGTQKPRILMKSGVGYRPKRDVRKRKRVSGERIDEDIVQINTKVVKRAKKSIEELLGLKVEEKKPEAPVEEKKVEGKEKKEEEVEAKPVEEKLEKKEEEKKKKVEEKPSTDEKPNAKRSKAKKSKEEKDG